MPILSQWHDQQRSILILTYSEPIEWGEFSTFFDNRNAEVYREKHPLCVIHEVEYIPSGSVLPHLKHLVNVTPERIVGAVVIAKAGGATNALLLAMLKVISSVERGTGMLNTAHTREEAIKMCEERLQKFTS